jgi:hypothetical protein
MSPRWTECNADSPAVVPVASMRPSFLRQSTKGSGRHTRSSERRSAATPQRHSTKAAAIIRAVPGQYPAATLARDPVSKGIRASSWRIRAPANAGNMVPWMEPKKLWNLLRFGAFRAGWRECRSVHRMSYAGKAEASPAVGVSCRIHRQRGRGARERFPSGKLSYRSRGDHFRRDRHATDRRDV